MSPYFYRFCHYSFSFLAVLCLCQIIGTLPLKAQYNIAQNTTTNACNGSLSDSNGNINNNNYGSNENYNFTVCIDNAASILIDFQSFSTEALNDVLSIHQGQNEWGASLGNSPYSGNVLPPPTVIYNTNNDPTFCFTFHFVSDLNITDNGFELTWQATLNELPPLQPFSIPDVDCFAQTVFLNLSTPILCSAVITDAFTILGANNPSISSATPLSCNAQGFTSQIALIFNDNIGTGSQYDIIFNYEYIDACGNAWQSTANADFWVNNCPLQVPSISLSNQLCDNCATITANVVGGDFNYNYQWQPPLGNINNALICLTEPELYAVTVTDGNGQTATQSIYVDVCSFQINFVDAPTEVCGGGGCFNLITETGGGSPPYNYTWSVPNGNEPIGNIAFVTPYCLGNSGTFSVTVTDALGNTTSNSFDANVCPMQVSINNDDIQCGCGNLVANASGGAGGPWGNDFYYTYNWSPPIANNTATNAICATGASIYSVTVTDIYGASASADIFVPVCPMQVSINAPATVCGNCANISLNINPPPAPNLTYTYTWNPPLPNGNVPSDTICPISATTYSVTVTNQLGETATASTNIGTCNLQVTIPPPAVCSGICTNIYANAAGGTPPYSYIWNDPTLLGGNPTICVTSPTNYSVTVTDSNGTSVTATQNANPCPLQVQIIAPEEFCHCEDIFAEAQGGTWDYAYAWNPALPATSGWHQLCLDENTVYSVTVTDLGTGETATATRELILCPFEVTIQGANHVCNDTVSIEAIINGGYPPYNITWNMPNIPPTTGIHNVVIDEPTAFIITVSDSIGYTIDDTLWVTPHQPPTLPDTVFVCLQDTSIQLNVLPTGGTWSGGSYINANSGLFNTVESGVGNFSITYTNDYCSDSMQVVVNPNPIVNDTVYCTSEGILALPLPNLLGGTWTGENIADPTNGEFEANGTGVFELIYTAPNACTTQNIVTVLQSVSVSSPSTQICSTVLNIDEFPTGGIWDVHAGLDFVNGILYPSGAGLGEHTLYYRIPGSTCVDSITITVTNVNIGTNDLIVCPEQPSFELPILSPQNGEEWFSLTPWQTGLSNTTGIYNPTLVGNGYEEYVICGFDNCYDTLHISVIPTLVTPDTLYFCRNDNLFDLSGIGSPVGGVWSGNGVIVSNNTPYFDPSISGTYTLTYSANNCSANLIISVSTTNAGEDVALCNPLESYILAPPIPAGGTWSGIGIPNSGNGIFNPTGLSAGQYELVYTAPLGCADTLLVTLSQTETPALLPIDPFFCLRDTNVVLIATPNGGVWSGNGIVDNNMFNPAIAGVGGWLLTYTYGNAECETHTYLGVSVGDTLRVQMSSDTLLCSGQKTVISAQAYGGKSNSYTYTWDQGLDHQQIHVVNPDHSQIYTVTVSDACSVPIVRQVKIDIAPPITYTLQTSDTLCYGETGYATINVPNPNNYTWTWQHDASLQSNSLNEKTGNYRVSITDQQTNCREEITATIPYYPLVAANFETQPNSSECFSTLDIAITDYSVGISEAYWDFGDGTSEPYIAGTSPKHTYPKTGIYTIKLYAENEGNCQSIYEQIICIDFLNDLLLPTAFSPNGDGVNDLFQASGIDIDFFELYIHNRWGQCVFSSNDINHAWDGIYQKQHCDIGTYSVYINYSTLQNKRIEQLRGAVTLLR